MRYERYTKNAGDTASGRPRGRARVRSLTAAAAALVAAGLLLAGTTAAVAAPAPVAATASAVAAAPYTVTPLTNADIHAGPAPSTAVTGRAVAGKPLGARCWLHGAVMVADGYSSDVWVLVDGGFVNALFLDDGPYGGLPASATC